ncbi:MAG TPA: hypothetical protein VGD22_07700 [Sphingobacteriaceae bacterium]
MKNYLFTLFLLGYWAYGFSQTKSVEDLYMDFRVERTEGTPIRALQIGGKIMAHTEKLPARYQDNFNYHMGKLYEVNHEDDKAILFYKKVAVAVPDYYVPHLALGNLYLKSARPFIQKLNASKNNRTEYDAYLNQYKQILVRALPHLEKAQACDPNEDTLSALQYIYQSLKTPEKNASLDSRLKALSVNCISLLKDD